MSLQFQYDLGELIQEFFKTNSICEHKMCALLKYSIKLKEAIWKVVQNYLRRGIVGILKLAIFPANWEWLQFKCPALPPWIICTHTQCALFDIYPPLRYWSARVGLSCCSPENCGLWVNLQYFYKSYEDLNPDRPSVSNDENWEEMYKQFIVPSCLFCKLHFQDAGNP